MSKRTHLRLALSSKRTAVRLDWLALHMDYIISTISAVSIGIVTRVYLF